MVIASARVVAKKADKRDRDGRGRELFPRIARWAIVGLLLAVGFAATGFTVALLSLAYVAAITPELVRVDLREHRLPNRLVVPGLAVGVIAWGIESLQLGHPVLTPLLASGAFAGFLLALCLLGGIGMGDVKLAAVLGLASWVPFVGVLSPVVGFLLGGVGSVILIARNRSSRRPHKARMAFGPYLLAGFWAAVALVAGARVLAGMA